MKNTGYEIHLQGKAPVMAGSLNSRNGKTSFVDSSGYPFALILPQSWQVPVEYIDLGIAYQDFLSFVGGDTAKRDWYMHARPLKYSHAAGSKILYIPAASATKSGNDVDVVYSESTIRLSLDNYTATFIVQ